MKKMRRFNEGGMGDLPESGSMDTADYEARNAADKAAYEDAQYRQALEQFSEPYKRPVARRAAPARSQVAGAGRGTQGGPTASQISSGAYGSGRGGQGGPTATELEVHRLKQIDKPLEADTTIEELLIPAARGARMLRTGYSAGKEAVKGALAKPSLEATYLGRVERAAPTERIGMDRAKMLGRSPDTAGARAQNLPAPRGGSGSAIEQAPSPKMLSAPRGGMSEPVGLTRRGMESMVPSNRAAVDAARRGNAPSSKQVPSRPQSKELSAMETEGGRSAPAPRRAAPAKAPARDREEMQFADDGNPNFRKGGMTKKFASGGSVSSASKRGDGIAQRGKTKGRYL